MASRPGCLSDSRQHREPIAGTLDAGLVYMALALVECPDGLPPPGWVVG
jgi:hypothetical protein